MERVVHIQEVGMRDGLQNEPQILSPETITALINQIQEAGLKRIQIGSFVNPKLVPQMAGTEEVWTRIDKKRDIRYSVLVLSRKGFQKALDLGIPHIEVFFSASDTHSRRNVGMSTDDAQKMAFEITEAALDNRIGVTLGIMCAFGCGYEGIVHIEHIVELVEKMPRHEAIEYSLADTTGTAAPENIREAVVKVASIIPIEQISLHLHDTHGRGLENLAAGLEVGIRNFDSSIGGLGGCPFVAGAPGNISTEKTVSFLHGLGLETGINEITLKRVWEILSRELKAA